MNAPAANQLMSVHGPGKASPQFVVHLIICMRTKLNQLIYIKKDINTKSTNALRIGGKACK